mmetsp:Transcript_15885/g.43204  ORF Transcript_15885/g.43204 Transcript_15885/m.43204 type:complete len:211 (+) Transcript_15885:125-757(+)
MECNGAKRRHLHRRRAVRCDADLGAGGHVVGADHVAVVAGGQGKLQGDAPSRRALAVQGDAGSVAAAESDGVVAKRLKVRHTVGARRGAPRHHVGNPQPAVLAHPRPAGKGRMGQVANNRRGLASASHVASVVHWRLRRALVVRVEVVGAHDLGIAVGVREHEDGGQLVDLPVLVGEIRAAPLGVVVVQEDHRVRAGHETPGGAEAVEVL